MSPFLLIINDGWGVAPGTRGNAITQAHTPTFNHLIKNYWVTTLQASGESVGLPWGEMGNSEVGHTSLGAGRIIYQDFPRITRAIGDSSFFENAAFMKAVEHTAQKQGVLHIAGLLSDGGIHAHVEHLYALLEFAKKNNVPRVVVHCFMDGRDTPYNSGRGFIEEMGERLVSFNPAWRIGTVSGRYFSMDRDERWDRIAESFRAMVQGESAKTFPKAVEAIDFYYHQDIYDEQIPPTVISPGVPMTDNDAVIFFNFRADRMRQIVMSLTLPDFNKFERSFLKDLCVVTMTEYDKGLPLEVAFPPDVVSLPLAKVLSDSGISQLHIAETEKYAHVTYFFNGGREEAFPGEQRILVPSPQEVATYDERPEMSAPEIAKRLMRELDSGKYGFAVVNFANADMVGHTGNLKATIEAVEVLDGIFKQLVETTLGIGGHVMITADHGNAEVLFDPQTGEINKEHTSNSVPCIIVGKSFLQEKQSIPDLSTYTSQGVLADVAPTILTIMGIPVPKEMTGRSLV